MKMYKVVVFVWIALIILLLHDPATGKYTTKDDGYSYSIEIEPFQYVPENEKLSDSSGKTVETGCHYQMDLVLVLDSSYTITSDGWVKLKDAAKRLTDKLDISSSGTHVSILVYSTNVDDYYIFDGNASKGKISKLIDELTYYGEWSRLDRALNAVLQRVFSPLNGARNDVPKVVVVFTDGKQEDPEAKPGQQPDLIRPLKQAIGNLRKENVTLFFAATEVSGFQVLNLLGGEESSIIGINNIDRLVERLLGASKMSCSENSKDRDLPFFPGDEPTMTMITTIRTAVTVAVGESLFQTPVTQKLSSKGSAAALISLSAITASVLTSSIGTAATEYSQLASATAVKSLSPTAPSEATSSAWTATATKITPSNKFIFSTETTTTVENLSPKPSNEPTFSILTFTTTNVVSLTPSNELISPTATATTGAIVALTPYTTTAWEATSPTSPTSLNKPNTTLAGTSTATESPTPSKEIISSSKTAAGDVLSLPTPFKHVTSSTGKVKDYDVLFSALSNPPTSSKGTIYTTAPITATPAVSEASLFTVTLP